MTKTIVTMVLVVMAASPAAAHPGHGVVGWLHHGELLALAAVAVTVTLVRRLVVERRRLEDR